MQKNLENNGTEVIGLVTPTPEQVIIKMVKESHCKSAPVLIKLTSIPCDERAECKQDYRQ